MALKLMGKITFILKKLIFNVNDHNGVKQEGLNGLGLKTIVF